MRQSFTMIYRTGGTERCTWRRCLATLDLTEAERQAADCERMGYKAIVHHTDRLNAVGMPTGWEV